MKLLVAISKPSSWFKTAWRRLGIRTARIEARIASCGLRLRLYRFKDLPALRRLLKPEIFSAASACQVKAFASSASLWRWVCRTFQVFYVIEVDERREWRMVGFAGIYNVEPGKSLWLSLVIFDPKDRRHGYGGLALKLLLSSFQKNHAVKTICGEVLASNTVSLHFLKELGFDIFGQDKNGNLLNFGGLAKSRHPGENRAPEEF